MTYPDKFPGNRRPFLRSLSGDPLTGDDLVRLIYTDESGTDPDLPYTVVAGLVVHGDRHWTRAYSLLEGHLEHVPKQFRDGFSFHAKDIWGNPKYHDVWPKNDRAALLASLMSIPKKLKIPLAFGIVPRTQEVPSHWEPCRPHQYHHAEAFARCMAGADLYIRSISKEKNEIAVVVAENVPEMHEKLQRAVDNLQSNPRKIRRPETVRANKTQLKRIRADGMRMAITRIAHRVLFETKERGSLLQLADACAYGMRRFVSMPEDKYGKLYMKMMLATKDYKESLFPNLEEGGAYGVFDYGDGPLKPKKKRPKA